MLYALYPPNFSQVVFLESWDGKVTQAPRLFQWTMDRPMKEVIRWAETIGWKWRVTQG